MSDRRMQSSRDDRRRDRDGDRGGDRRRRSRSPAHRHRNGHEENSYESSRNYREREREQRHGGGGGDRERRDWDRDRGSARRDARRDDDHRRDPRRDRDHFDDRRRHGRDDRRENGGGQEDRARDRDDMRQMERQQRQKSASPVRKPKEPTPDLTDIVSVLERKRRLTQWDVKPTGYDNVTAEQAKLSGMFPLPGAPRAQPMDQSRLQAFMSQPQNQVSQDALKSTTSRQSKRVIVQNLPESATDSRLSDFFNLQLNGMTLTVEKDPCVLASISADHQTALLEFKTPEDATNALALDGAEMESNAMSDGVPRGLQIRRPKDYIVPTAVRDTEGQNGRVSRTVPDTQSKIMITKIPTFLDEDQIQELLQSFGELRSMALAKDTDTNESRGFAFCEWIDAAGTDTAVESLNGMQLGEVNLIVQKACVGLQQVEGEMSVSAMSLLAGTKTEENADSGRVLCLMNMITPEELLDPDEADEITDDVKEECAKFGTVVEVKMPRPTPGDRSNAGIGKIYIKFGDSDTAQKALGALAGRKFADRTVVATYFSEEYFDLNAW